MTLLFCVWTAFWEGVQTIGESEIGIGYGDLERCMEWLCKLIGEKLPVRLNRYKVTKKIMTMCDGGKAKQSNEWIKWANILQESIYAMSRDIVNLYCAKYY